MKFRTIRRDRFGRFSKRGQTITRVRIRVKPTTKIVVRARRPIARKPKPTRSRVRANRRSGRLKSTARGASAITRATRQPAASHTELVTIPAGRDGADPLQVQLTAKFAFARGRGMQPSAALTKAAYRFRIENGYDAPGVTTSIVRWNNPARVNPKDRTWRQGDQDAAFKTLGNALLAWSRM